MRILVIEDERKIASFIKRGLREEGYTVDTAFGGTGADGLRLQLSCAPLGQKGT